MGAGRDFGEERLNAGGKIDDDRVSQKSCLEICSKFTQNLVRKQDTTCATGTAIWWRNERLIPSRQCGNVTSQRYNRSREFESTEVFLVFNLRLNVKGMVEPENRQA